MIELPTMECKRCHHKWTPRVPNPRECPRCKSPYWDKERKKRGKEIVPPLPPEPKKEELVLMKKEEKEDEKQTQNEWCLFPY